MVGAPVNASPVHPALAETKTDGRPADRLNPGASRAPEPPARADPERCPEPLRARAGALAVRCASASRLLPTLRVCCWLFVTRGAGDAATKRSALCAECFEPRSCVVRDACCRPRAARKESFAFSAIGSKPAGLLRLPAPRALQIAGYLCSFRLLAPLRVTVVAALPPRSAAGGLPLAPFGYSQHVVASARKFQVTSCHGMGSSCRRGGVVPMAASLRSADLRS